MPPPVHFRRGETADLDAINAVITRAIGTWTVSDRVKRLALPSYHYQPEDFTQLEFMVALLNQRVTAVAAWEPAAASELPADHSGLLLHGLFVDPDAAGRGLGSSLLQACITAAREKGLDGVLVRATRDSASFFEHCGMRRLPVLDDRRDHAMRYWLPT